MEDAGRPRLRRTVPVLLDIPDERLVVIGEVSPAGTPRQEHGSKSKQNSTAHGPNGNAHYLAGSEDG